MNTTAYINSAAIYNDRYKYGYNWKVYQEIAEKLTKVMQYTGAPKCKIMDIACGVGWFTDHVYWNVTKDITGIDFSKKAIMFHARRMFPAITFDVADIFNYDYSGYNCFVIMEVLEHLKDDTKLLKMLPSGSKVYFTVPYGKERQDITHVREYTEETIKERYGKILDLQCNEHEGQFLLCWGIKK